MSKRWWVLLGVLWLGFYGFFRWHSVAHQSLTQTAQTDAEPILLSLVSLPIRVFIEFWVFGLPASIPAIGLFFFVKTVCTRIGSDEGLNMHRLRWPVLALGLFCLGLYLVLHWWSLPTHSGPLPWGGMGGGPGY